MNHDQSEIEEKILDICETDTRYSADAYFFLNEALSATVDEIAREQGSPRHLTGQELCLGLKKYAIAQYGPMTDLVLETWGLRETEDFGEIVYNLIAVGLLTKTSTDKKSDFAGVYDFYDAFVAPYKPKFDLRHIRRGL